MGRRLQSSRLPRAHACLCTLGVYSGSRHSILALTAQPATTQVPAFPSPSKILGSHPAIMGKGAGEGVGSTVAHESIEQMTAELENVKIGATTLAPP